MHYNKFEYSAEKGARALELATVVGITVNKVGSNFSFKYKKQSHVGSADYVLRCLCVAVATEGSAQALIPVHRYADPIDKVLAYTPRRLANRIAAKAAKAGESDE